MPFQCLSEEIAAAPVPMDVTPTQRMMSACVGVLATSLVVTPMGESYFFMGRRSVSLLLYSGGGKRASLSASAVSHAATCAC